MVRFPFVICTATEPGEITYIHNNVVAKNTTHALEHIVNFYGPQLSNIDSICITVVGVDHLFTVGDIKRRIITNNPDTQINAYMEGATQ